MSRKMCGLPACCRVPERGLSHEHCIFFLSTENKEKFNNPDYVHTIISARIPPKDDPVLRELVIPHMIHGPCGRDHPYSVCMDDGSFTKGYPSLFQNKSGTDEDDVSQYYISLRRRSPENVGQKDIRRATVHTPTRSYEKDIPAGNSWVVPYNTHLLRMFACHINVDICISREGVIKYLFKYVCKDHDRLTIHLKPKN